MSNSSKSPAKSAAQTVPPACWPSCSTVGSRWPTSVTQSLLWPARTVHGTKWTTSISLTGQMNGWESRQRTAASSTSASTASSVWVGPLVTMKWSSLWYLSLKGPGWNSLRMTICSYWLLMASIGAIRRSRSLEGYVSCANKVSLWATSPRQSWMSASDLSASLNPATTTSHS